VKVSFLEILKCFTFEVKHDTSPCHNWGIPLWRRDGRFSR